MIIFISMLHVDLPINHTCFYSKLKTIFLFVCFNFSLIHLIFFIPIYSNVLLCERYSLFDKHGFSYCTLLLYNFFSYGLFNFFIAMLLFT